MFKTKTVSNSFAEHVNGQIKKAYRIGHHYSFLVLRIKCVYGGVTVQRRPPHPLDEVRFRVVRTGRAGGERGKKRKANLEILRQARIEADATRGLLPRPEEHSGWAKRFDVAEMERVLRAPEEPEPAAQIEMAFAGEEEEQSPVPSSGRKHRTKYNPDQIKLF